MQIMPKRVYDRRMPARRYSDAVQIKLHAVAVYGTLRTGMRLHHLIEHCPLIDKGVLRGAEMYSFTFCPGIILTPHNQENIVKVEVFAVDDETLEQLDRLEGWYDREVVQVELDDGRTQDALVYVQQPDGVTGHARIESGDWVEFQQPPDDEIQSSEVA